MPIYIAITEMGYVENIVLARNKELADVYWQGKGVHAHAIREIQENDLLNHPTGVIPIISTTVKSLYINGLFRDVRIITKK